MFVKDVGGGMGREVEVRVLWFMLGIRDVIGFLQGDFMIEIVVENIVISILKQFIQFLEIEVFVEFFLDIKVIYGDRKEFFGERKIKIEIVVELKLIEDVDIFDEVGLDYFLSKDIKEVGLKGRLVEQMIGDVINFGLKGREGRVKVVNVEIVEEFVSYVSEGKLEEFFVLFKVEEVEDVFLGFWGLVKEEEGYGESDFIFLVNQY